MRPFQIRGGGRGRTTKALFFPFAAPFLSTLHKEASPSRLDVSFEKRAPKDRVHVALVLCGDRALPAPGVPPVSPQIINFTGGNYFLPPPVLSRRLGGGGEAQAEGALSRRRGPGEEGGRKQKHAVLADKLLDPPHPLLNASLASNECRRHSRKDAGP